MPFIKDTNIIDIINQLIENFVVDGIGELSSCISRDMHDDKYIELTEILGKFKKVKTGLELTNDDSVIHYDIFYFEKFNQYVKFSGSFLSTYDFDHDTITIVLPFQTTDYQTTDISTRKNAEVSY